MVVIPHLNVTDEYLEEYLKKHGTLKKTTHKGNTAYILGRYLYRFSPENRVITFSKLDGSMHGILFAQYQYDRGTMFILEPYMMYAFMKMVKG